MESGSAAVIRQCTQSDLAPLHRMIQETLTTSYREVYPVRAVEFFKSFHREEKIAKRSRTGEVLILEQNGSFLATGCLLRNEILGVFVAPGMQRRGYGKAIMEELEKRAKAHGIEEIHLSVSLPSRKFYESLGYDLFGKESIDVGDGQRLEYWPAQKTLR